ncbi:MAG TPA: sugar phosphate nucleotidyltransferase [Ignavibacteriaceae bacterium]|nr:sugar phosphate nucleotidyltransferase [Ignavibacteriaceae bacterium]
MRAVIPVAGIGTRLKPHTFSTPKVLLNVGGKPILGHILDKLTQEGLTKITLVIGYLGDMIKEYVAKEYPMVKADFIVQEEMHGLGHAIYVASPTFENEDIFVILGDTLFDVDLKHVFKSRHSSLGVKEVEDPRRFGVAVVKNGIIQNLVEKPQNPVSKLALVGLYYFSDSEILKASLNELVEKDIRTGGELQFTDAIQLMINRGEKITTFPVDGWYDCGKPETLLSTNQYLLSKRDNGREIESVVINKPVFIADDAVIKNSVIGPYTTIASGSIIEDSIIRNSLIGSGAKVFKSMLENSIIGDDSVIKGSFYRLNSGNSTEIDFY